VSRAHAHRVVVTGIGAVSTFGVGAEVLWRQLRAGISGIQQAAIGSLNGRAIHGQSDGRGTW